MTRTIIVHCSCHQLGMWQPAALPTRQKWMLKTVLWCFYCCSHFFCLVVCGTSSHNWPVSSMNDWVKANLKRHVWQADRETNTFSATEILTNALTAIIEMKLISYMDCNRNEYNYTKYTLKTGPRGELGDTGQPAWPMWRSRMEASCISQHGKYNVHMSSLNEVWS